MKKKIKKWISIIGKKNMIAISALALVVVVVCVGFAVKNNKKDNDESVSQEESVGLQVMENADDAEGDSVDFSEFLSEDEENNKKEDKKDQASNNSSGLEQKENADDEDGNSVDFNEVVKEESPILDVELDGKSEQGYTIKKDSDFSHLKDEVKAVIKDIKEGKEPVISDTKVQAKLEDKKPASEVLDIEPKADQKKEDGYYIVDLTVKDLSKKYTKVVVLHYSEERTLWEVIEPSKVDGDVITVKFKDLSPVIIYGEPIVEDKTDETPGTGDNDETQGGTQDDGFGPLF